MRKVSVAVIGESGVKPGSDLYILAERLGKILVDHNYRIVNGGMSGVMEACCKGAKSSSNYSEGMTVCILPTFNPNDSNQYADVVIPTGLDNYRNGIVANCDAVIALGGKAGTLSEMAFAWTFKRMIISYDVPGWSGKLAGTKIDDRKRIEWEGDRVFKVSSGEEVVEKLNKYLTHYTQRHDSIVSIMKNQNR